MYKLVKEIKQSFEHYNIYKIYKVEYDTIGKEKIRTFLYNTCFPKFKCVLDRKDGRCSE